MNAFRSPLGWLLLVVLLSGCATRLPPQDLPLEHAQPAASEGLIGRHVEAAVAGQESGLSGFSLLYRGMDALAARLHLIEQARQSLDIQYYIYNGDVTGGLIAERLLSAADRGVRVRLLLDDIGSGVNEFKIATLDQHPNIEIRLFNPLSLRQGWLRYVSKVGEFGRINYRMHNKVLIADNQAMITGGRNIGDEYFALSELDFQDIDVLGIGPISRAASNSFDAYWNSHKSVPVRLLTRRPGRSELVRLRKRLESVSTDLRQGPYQKAVDGSPFNQPFTDNKVNWHWGEATWLADPPDKADPHGDHNQVPYLGMHLARQVRASQRELQLMTAYFVPGADGQGFLMDMVNQGLEVSILTNSLATTDVLAVHSGYVRYREPLLAHGVRIWELRPLAAQQERASPFLGESVASLHAKTFVFDRERVFVGSINLDPRSISLNTEAGVLVQQPALAGEMVELFERWTSDDYAYRLSLDEQGRLQWHAEGQTWTREPKAGPTRRIMTWLLRLLPIESQL